MANPLVDKWRQRGIVSAWHFRYDSEWSFTADDDGCDALVELLNVMHAGKWSGKRTIILKSPQQVANETGRMGKRKSPAKLVLKYLPPPQATEDYWVIKYYPPKSLEIHFGLSSLVQLRDAIISIKEGKGDYSIGNDSFPLWIWWYVK